jgi:hypothetical protein
LAPDLVSIRGEDRFDIFFSLAKGALPPEMALSDLHAEMLHMSIEVFCYHFFLKFRSWVYHEIS